MAVWCSSASFVSLNSRTFSMAMTAWSAKVLQQRDLLVGERLEPPSAVTLMPRWPRLRAASAPPGRSGSPQRLGRALPSGYSSAAATDVVRRGRSSGARGPPGPRRCRGSAGESPDSARGPRAARARRRRSTSPSNRKTHDIVRRTEPRGALGDRVEHRLDVGRRAGDDPQDLGRGGLLLQRSVTRGSSSAPEQPHVLDGDHGLVGEGLEQRDLLGRERPDLRALGSRMRPIGTPSRSSGVASTVRMPSVGLLANGNSPSDSACMSWT